MMDQISVRLVLVALVASVGSSAWAQSPTPNVNDGNALQRECETALQARQEDPDARPETTADADEDDVLERGYHMGQCLGLVSGVWHTHMLMVDEFDGDLAFCPSRTISTGQMAGIVSQYLQVHPTELGEWDTVLILRAFRDAYPCGRR